MSENAANFSNDQLLAMEAIFDLHEAVMDGDMTTREIVDIVRASVEAGHDSIMICLVMALEAVKVAQKEAIAESAAKLPGQQ